MKRGETLVIAMTNNSPAFSTDLNSETEFPAGEVFKGAGKGLVASPTEWAEKIFRDEETTDTAGLKMANPDFKVVLTTGFEADSIKEFLFDEGFGLAAFSPALFQIVIIEQEE